MHLKERKPLGQILLEDKKITEEQLNHALEVQRETGDRLGHTLVKLGYITEEELAKALEKQFGIPCIMLKPQMVNPLIARSIPENICRKYKIIPFMKENNKLIIAAANPYNLEFINEIKATTAHNVQLILATEKSIVEAIERNFGKKEFTSEDDYTLPSGVPAQRLLDMLLKQAYFMKAKEIHLEFSEGKFNILFMTPVKVIRSNPLSDSYYKPISLLIKNKAHLDTMENKKFQEGIFKVKVYEKEFMVRVFVFPTPVGENILLKFS